MEMTLNRFPKKGGGGGLFASQNDRRGGGGGAKNGHFWGVFGGGKTAGEDNHSLPNLYDFVTEWLYNWRVEC